MNKDIKLILSNMRKATKDMELNVHREALDALVPLLKNLSDAERNEIKTIMHHDFKEGMGLAFKSLEVMKAITKSAP